MVIWKPQGDAICSGSKCTNNALVYKLWWTTVHATLNDNVSCYCNEIKLMYANSLEQDLVSWEYSMTVTWALEVLPLPKFLLPTWTLNSFLYSVNYAQIHALDCSECGFSILPLVSPRIKIVPSHTRKTTN